MTPRVGRPASRNYCSTLGRSPAPAISGRGPQYSTSLFIASDPNCAFSRLTDFQHLWKVLTFSLVPSKSWLSALLKVGDPNISSTSNGHEGSNNSVNKLGMSRSSIIQRTNWIHRQVGDRKKDKIRIWAGTPCTHFNSRTIYLSSGWLISRRCLSLKKYLSHL